MAQKETGEFHYTGSQSLDELYERVGIEGLFATEPKVVSNRQILIGVGRLPPAKLGDPLALSDDWIAKNAEPGLGDTEIEALRDAYSNLKEREVRAQKRRRSRAPSQILLFSAVVSSSSRHPSQRKSA